MKFQVSDTGVFIPAFKKNREQAASEQIAVRFRCPTTAMKNRCRRKPQAKAISGKDGAIEKLEILLEKDDVQTLNEMLVSISGCSFSAEDGGEVFIRSAKELVNAPIFFEPLLKEIVEEFDRVLDNADVNEKN
jgi:hypothetical protein